MSALINAPETKRTEYNPTPHEAKGMGKKNQRHGEQRTNSTAQSVLSGTPPYQRQSTVIQNVNNCNADQLPLTAIEVPDQQSLKPSDYLIPSEYLFSQPSDERNVPVQDRARTGLLKGVVVNYNKIYKDIETKIVKCFANLYKLVDSETALVPPLKNLVYPLETFKSEFQNLSEEFYIINKQRDFWSENLKGTCRDLTEGIAANPVRQETRKILTENWNECTHSDIFASLDKTTINTVLTHLPRLQGIQEEINAVENHLRLIKGQFKYTTQALSGSSKQLCDDMLLYRAQYKKLHKEVESLHPALSTIFKELMKDIVLGEDTLNSFVYYDRTDDKDRKEGKDFQLISNQISSNLAKVNLSRRTCAELISDRWKKVCESFNKCSNELNCLEHGAVNEGKMSYDSFVGMASWFGNKAEEVATVTFPSTLI